MTNDNQAALPLIVQMVLLAKPIQAAVSDIERALQQYFPGAPAQIEPAGDNAWVIDWIGLKFTVMHIDKPIPAETFDTALRTSYGLQNGKELVSQHQAHLIIAPMQKATSFHQAITMSGYTMYLTDALSNLAGPLAYYWSSSESLIDLSQFKNSLVGFSQAIELNRKGEENSAAYFPATYWVGLRLFSPDQKSLFGAITKGLDSYIGYELEIRPLTWKPQEIAQRIYGTISFLFRYGDVVNDGETLGVSETEHFRIRKQAATEDMPARLVLTLEVS